MKTLETNNDDQVKTEDGDEDMEETTTLCLSAPETVAPSPADEEYLVEADDTNMSTEDYVSQDGGEILQCFSESALSGVSFLFEDMVCAPEWASPLENEGMCGF